MKLDSFSGGRSQEVLAKHDHYKKRTQRHDYLLRGLLYSLDADSPCLVTTQPRKGLSYYRSKARINGNQIYYSCHKVDEQASEVLKSLAIQQEFRPRLESALHEWFTESGKDDEDSELNRTRQRPEFLTTKRKNINRMAAEQIIGWDKFKELRDEVEGGEATLKSRIDFITKHQTLFAADFELALDIACNLGWLFLKGNFEERQLLAEALFKSLNVSQGEIVSYELNPPFAIFCNNMRNPAESDAEGNGLMVRYESLVAGEEGLEPSLPGPEPGVLPLDYSPAHQNYSYKGLYVSKVGWISCIAPCLTCGLLKMFFHA